MGDLAARPGQLIDPPPHSRYDRHNRNTSALIGARVEDAATLERRLDAGQWLSTGQVAVLLDTSRFTVIRIVNEGRTINGAEYRIRTRGLGRQRELNPEDVRRLLDARRQVSGDNGE